MNAKQKTETCIEWIKDYFEDNPDGKAIIGISGGKDSTIAAALCVEALGADRVIGVMMSNGVQPDINDAEEVCRILDIRGLRVNMLKAFTSICDQIDYNYGYTLGSTADNNMVKTNLPARLRMATLYAVAALYPNSRVVNTCNRSEDYIGYSTKYGDAAGDFSPLGNLTVREVLEIGDELGLPEYLVHKTPSDGMCGKSDEENIGFTYKELDDYILGTGPVSDTVVNKIIDMHNASRHKFLPIPTYDPHIYEWWELKQSKGCRGLRAKSGIIMDDCATGGIINPREFPLMPNEYVVSVDIAPPKPYNPFDACQPQFDKTMEALDRLNETIDRKLREQQMNKEIGGKV